MEGRKSAILNGVSLWHRQAGRGPHLVTQAPGWGVGGLYLEQTLRPLEDAFTVLYHDPRGSGRSERPARVEEIDVGRLVEDLEALREHLGIGRFALLGHSHGGFTAMNYALRHPDCLSHLILVGPSIGPEELRADTEQSLRRLAGRPEYAEAARAWPEGNDVSSDEEFGTWLGRTMPLYFHRPEVGMAIFSRLGQGNPSLAAARGTRPSDIRFAVRERLREIRTPTLLLVGRHDFITPPERVAEIREAVPGSRMIVFEESGHFPWFEEPDAFFRAIREFVLA
jgi:proline iminopeptidase